MELIVTVGSISVAVWPEPGMPGHTSHNYQHGGHGGCPAQPGCVDQGGPPAARPLYWGGHRGRPLPLPTIIHSSKLLRSLLLSPQVHLQSEDSSSIQEFPGRTSCSPSLAFVNYRRCQSVWRLHWTPDLADWFISDWLRESWSIILHNNAGISSLPALSFIVFISI